jgi:hypothetical protein
MAGAMCRYVIAAYTVLVERRRHVLRERAEELGRAKQEYSSSVSPRFEPFRAVSMRSRRFF